MVAYHPNCPHCHSMMADYIKLAKNIKSNDVQLNVVAINMSKTMTDANEMKIDGYPTIRLYENGDHEKFVEFEDHRKYDTFVKFLQN